MSGCYYLLGIRQINRGEKYMDTNIMPSGIYDRPEHRQTLPVMAYVTPQMRVGNVYGAEEALRMGTLFPELNKPFNGKRGEV